MARKRSTVGQLLINSALPEDMRDYTRILDKKGLSALLSDLAKKHPDKYRETVYRLGRIGEQAAYTTGGNSFGLAHMKMALSAKRRRLFLNRHIGKLLDDDSLSDEQRETGILKAVGKMQGEQQDEIFDESWEEGNPLAIQLVGAGRGSKMNLASLRG